MATNKKRRITAQEVRDKFPAIKDAAFADAISVTEAVKILGVSDNIVRERIDQGRLAGKAITTTCYVVSEKSVRGGKVSGHPFADAISVPQAMLILGMTDNGVRRRIQRGQLVGKILAPTCYIVSEKDARRQAAEYLAEGRGKGRNGRPRSRA